MLKKQLVFSLLACAIAIGMHTSAMARPTSAITANLGNMVFGTFALQYETALSNNNSLVVQGEFGNLRIGDWDLTNLGAGIGYRIYPGQKATAPTGVWFGPLVKLANVSATYQDETASSIYFTGGAELGYQWIFGDDTGFALGLSLGFYYVNGAISVNDNDLNYGGVVPGLGLNAGIGF